MNLARAREALQRRLRKLRTFLAKLRAYRDRVAAGSGVPRESQDALRAAVGVFPEQAQGPASPAGGLPGGREIFAEAIRATRLPRLDLAGLNRYLGEAQSEIVSRALGNDPARVSALLVPTSLVGEDRTRDRWAARRQLREDILRIWQEAS